MIGPAPPPGQSGTGFPTAETKKDAKKWYERVNYKIGMKNAMYGSIVGSVMGSFFGLQMGLNMVNVKKFGAQAFWLLTYASYHCNSIKSVDAM